MNRNWYWIHSYTKEKVLMTSHKLTSVTKISAVSKFHILFKSSSIHYSSRKKVKQIINKTNRPLNSDFRPIQNHFRCCVLRSNVSLLPLHQFLKTRFICMTYTGLKQNFQMKYVAAHRYGAHASTIHVYTTFIFVFQYPRLTIYYKAKKKNEIPFVFDIAKTAIVSSNPNCSISASKAGSTRSSLFSGSAGCEQLAPATAACANEICGSNRFDVTKIVFQGKLVWEYQY